MRCAADARAVLGYATRLDRAKLKIACPPKSQDGAAFAYTGDRMSVRCFTVSSMSTPALRDLADVIEDIGTDRFAPQLMSLLHRMCGADHCAIYRLEENSLDQLFVGSAGGGNRVRDEASRYIDLEYWRRDPAICEARSRVQLQEPVMIQVEIDTLGDVDLRNAIFPHVRERLFVAGRRRAASYGLSILRADTRSPYADENVNFVLSSADMLVSLLAKHVELSQWRSDYAFRLSSLAEIERCLVAHTEMPRRQVEVCSRILYGMSTTGVALDLGIGEESVKSYRKRAYERLSIGTERELLNWYITLWRDWKAGSLCDSRTWADRT